MRKIIAARLLAAVLCTAPFIDASAQRQWTLDECIEYALEHNINIQQRIVQIRQQEAQASTSRHAWLPEVNASVGEQFSFGNYNASTGSMDATATDVNRDLAYTTGQISASVPLFNGFRILNQTKADESLLEAATANLEQARKDLRIQIATYYLQCLYYKSLAEVAAEQVSTSEALVEKAKAMVEEGKSPRSEQAEAESQLASDQASLTDAEGQAEMALLTLSQLLNLPDFSGFDVAPITEGGIIAAAHPQAIYESIVDRYPSIVAAKAQIKANEHLLKVAKAGYYPTLSLQASVLNFHVNMFHYDTGWGSFGDQLENNHNEVLGMHLAIPIFNGFNTKNNVRRAKLDVLNQRLALDDASQKLRNEIQTAWHNASLAQKRQESAEKAMEAAEISLSYEQTRYDEGRGDIFTLRQSSQSLLRAKQDAIQAKYENLIRQRILQFYQE